MSDRGVESAPGPLARRLVEVLGGRYSRELGIDVDAGEPELERWFVASTLFGNRISAAVAERTFRVLDQAGLVTIAQARHVSWDELVALLDAGGYARYDFRTATRLQALSEVVDERYAGRVSEIIRRARSADELEGSLDALPGWGPVTVGLFLRELRGRWPTVDPSLDPRAARAARHLGLFEAERGVAGLRAIADDAGIDVRDLESALVRVALAHGKRASPCEGGAGCRLLQSAQTTGVAGKSG